jgi:hypothetical protein
VSRSIDPDGSVRPADELLVDLAGRVTHAWVDRDGAAPVSTIDLLGDGFTLFVPDTVDDRQVTVRAAAMTVPVAVRRLPSVVARALGVRSGGALLVRPDGGTVAAWSRAPLAPGALASAISDYVRGAGAPSNARVARTFVSAR